MGGSTSFCSLDWNISNAGYLTINQSVMMTTASTCNNYFKTKPTGATVAGPVGACYTNTGAAINNSYHTVMASATAGSTTGSVALSGGAVFTQTPYGCIIIDLTTLAIITAITAISTTGVSWTAVSGHNYQVMLWGV
jgi:hypothetical protein